MDIRDFNITWRGTSSSASSLQNELGVMRRHYALVQSDSDLNAYDVNKLIDHAKAAAQSTVWQAIVDCVQGSDRPRFIENLLVADVMSKLNDLSDKERDVLARSLVNIVDSASLDMFFRAQLTQDGRCFQFKTNHENICFDFSSELLTFLFASVSENPSLRVKLEVLREKFFNHIVWADIQKGEAAGVTLEALMACKNLGWIF